MRHRPGTRPNCARPLGSNIHAGDAGEDGEVLRHLPVMLLVSQARLAALEDFRASVAALHAGPSLHDICMPAASAPPFDAAEALAHIARFAQPGIDPGEVCVPLQRIADEAKRRERALFALFEDQRLMERQKQQRQQQQQEEREAPSDDFDGGQQQRQHKRRRLADSDARPARQVPDEGGWAARHAEAAAAQLLALGSAMAEMGFSPNLVDPHDPDNCFADRILQRRIGTPFTLALLWLAVAGRMGLPLVPWILPDDTVLLKLQLPGGYGALMADPTGSTALRVAVPAATCAAGPEASSGERPDATPAAGAWAAMSEAWEVPEAPEELQTAPLGDAGDAGDSGDAGDGTKFVYIPELLIIPDLDPPAGDDGASAPPAPAPVPGRAAACFKVAIGPSGAGVGEASPLSVRALMGYALMDVKRTYLLTGMYEEALWIIKYMRALDPWSGGDLRDEGLVLFALGRYHEAYAPLATYLEVAGPSAPDAEEVKEVLSRVSAAIKGAGPIN